MKDVKYSPNFAQNLLSIPKLIDKGACALFENNEVIVKYKEQVVMKGIRTNGLYYLEGENEYHRQNDTSLFVKEVKVNHQCIKHEKALLVVSNQYNKGKLNVKKSAVFVSKNKLFYNKIKVIDAEYLNKYIRDIIKDRVIRLERNKTINQHDDMLKKSIGRESYQVIKSSIMKDEKYISLR